MRSPLRDRTSTSLDSRWIRLAPVIATFLALAALVAFPWIASWRLAKLRLYTAETIAPARRLVRDIPAALALELAAQDQAETSRAPELARSHNEAVAIETSRDSALSALAPRLDNRLAEDIARLRLLTAQWRAERAGDATAAGTGVSLSDVLAVAARLDTGLMERQVQQGLHIRSLETENVLLSTVLVPLLALVMIAILRTGRRMTALAKDAEASRVALAVASERKVTWLRGLTHDLKNALGTAGGFASLLLEETSGPLTTEQRDHVTRLRRILERTTVEVEDALTVARAEAGALPVRRRAEDLRAVALESAADYVVAAERAGLTFTVEFADDLPQVDTDGSLVSKIIGNLLSNALKYTPAGGRLWLRASSRLTNAQGEGPWVVLEVCDSGPGIPAAIREQVFDEFFRAPTATTTASGQGIGLAMSRRVARLLGGEITLGSGDGPGCVFTLWLPAPSRGAAHPESAPPRGERTTNGLYVRAERGAVA